MSEPIQIVTTTPNREVAERIAKSLVEQQLVACAQIDGPILSFYEWQGKVEESTEFRCTLKTDRRLFSRIVAVMDDLHPYDVPGLIALPICDASSTYLDWLNKSLLK